MNDPNAGLYKFSTPHVLIYPHLLTPRAFKDPKTGREGKPRYEASFLFNDLSDIDLTAMVTIAADAARAMHPGRDLKSLRMPFKKGDELAAKAEAKSKERNWAKGSIILETKTEHLPKMGVVKAGRVVDLLSPAEVAANIGAFYSGTEAYAQVRFVAYEGMGGGVTAYLQHVLSLNKGDKIAGGQSTAEVFGGYIGIETNEDPTRTSHGALADIL